MDPMETQGADTSVVVDSGTLASTSIGAQVVGAFIGDADLAVGSGPSRRTGTSVRTLAGVEASGAIVAGLVIGAVVQVLVAKKTAPAFFAVASPRFITGSMLASRVSDTIVAEGSLPTIPAPLKREKNFTHKLVRDKSCCCWVFVVGNNRWAGYCS